MNREQTDKTLAVSQRDRWQARSVQAMWRVSLCQSATAQFQATENDHFTSQERKLIINLCDGDEMSKDLPFASRFPHRVQTSPPSLENLANGLENLGFGLESLTIGLESLEIGLESLISTRLSRVFL